VRAQLTPTRYTTLGAEISARIGKLPIAEGERFKTGALLVQFDCSMQRAQLERARAEFSASEQTFKANLQLQKLNSVGKLDLELSRAAVQKAKADVSMGTALVQKCEIRAPFAGRVVEQKVREEQVVQPGQPLLEILDDTSLELEFIAPSSWLSWVAPGQAFEVRIDETGKTYAAQFTRIGARVDPVSQTVKIAGRITGQHPELMAGMSGVVRVSQTPAPSPPTAREGTSEKAKGSK
jgi:RND family efflux transporter MFP subunit